MNSSSRDNSFTTSFLLAVSFVGICTLLRVALLEAMGLSAPFLLHFFFILVATMVGGGRTGVITVFLSALVIALLFLPPEGSLHSKSFQDLVATALFCLLGTLFVLGFNQLRRRMTRTLTSASLWETVVSSLPNHAIFTLDSRGVITSWNPGVETVFGYRPDEFIGQHYSSLFSDSDRELLEQRWHESDLSLGNASEHLYRRRDGSVFHAVGSLYLLKGRRGHSGGYVKIVEDKVRETSP